MDHKGDHNALATSYPLSPFRYSTATIISVLCVMCPYESLTGLLSLELLLFVTSSVYGLIPADTTIVFRLLSPYLVIGLDPCVVVAVLLPVEL